MVRILIALVVIAVVGFAGYSYFMGTDSGQETLSNITDQATDALNDAGEAASEQLSGLTQALEGLPEEASEVSNGLQTALRDLQSTLSGVTAESSADAVQQELGAVNDQLQGLQTSVEGLSEESRKLIASGVSAILPTIKSAIEQVSQIEGIGESVKPTLDSIIAALESWAQAPA